jgi:hypothetical protein
MHVDRIDPRQTSTVSRGPSAGWGPKRLILRPNKYTTWYRSILQQMCDVCLQVEQAAVRRVSTCYPHYRDA